MMPLLCLVYSADFALPCYWQTLKSKEIGFEWLVLWLWSIPKIKQITFFLYYLPELFQTFNDVVAVKPPIVSIKSLLIIGKHSF
jgi:hypothetical protein